MLKTNEKLERNAIVGHIRLRDALYLREIHQINIIYATIHTDKLDKHIF